MSLTKDGTIDGMKFEVEKRRNKKVDGKTVALKMASQLSTSSLLWLVVKRHKVGLLAIGNVVLVLNWAFPEWPQLVLGLVGK